ncbi:hypothetical protein A2685_01670 [Candidatus Woesebacteria bacterium RIFCSPHIGHO2_01_FULL_37_10]|uniref:Response regulatory domain-containing protein n=1 Tax=Candidatus Woesebacteria bacterium RIFCSPHIGHO2_01_FULL_37_10 TaxID=1802489 RepID=A0A1F7XV59_9BACT|nr:MAG: hypothetical protein A2685_01670 [Candidatus Woesebacteria bacterium RIFCSPHIGHO2_01_FULL_37_10]
MAKILVVDDDLILGRLYKSALENDGHEVVTAADGEEGLEKVKSFHPSFILSDIMMPRMDGLTFLKKLKDAKETKDIPVIVMTNLNDEENAKIAEKDGALKLVLKNEQGPQEVVKLIKEVLNSGTTSF